MRKRGWSRIPGRGGRVCQGRSNAPRRNAGLRPPVPIIVSEAARARGRPAPRSRFRCGGVCSFVDKGPGSRGIGLPSLRTARISSRRAGQRSSRWCTDREENTRATPYERSVRSLRPAFLRGASLLPWQTRPPRPGMRDHPRFSTPHALASLLRCSSSFVGSSFALVRVSGTSFPSRFSSLRIPAQKAASRSWSKPPLSAA